ncbi:MAG: STAS domain-containing protein [Planctomycetia bacterium]|nr:STAS domain-containing protein [Planctomycetia bacterium]
MTDYRHISLNVVDDICVIRLLDSRIVDDISILELGNELFTLVEEGGHTKLLLNFSSVEFLSSAALGKLIMLYKKITIRKGALKLCCITPDIRELFTIMNLDRIFDIREEEADALAAF